MFYAPSRCPSNRVNPNWCPTPTNTKATANFGPTPHAAKTQALADHRSVLRPAPACPWWPFIWSRRTNVRVGDDGQVPVGAQRHPIAAPPRSRVIRSLHPNGDIYYRLHAPDPQTKPIVLLHCPAA